MKERPILYSGPMILAKLAGNKDVTRRLVSPQPFVDGTGLIGHAKLGGLFGAHVFNYCATKMLSCPYGVAGDRLWIREAWRTVESLDLLPPSQLLETVPVRYEADGVERGKFRESTGRYRHGRFMPRWASRMSDDVVSTRIERLHDITEEEARREGLARVFDGDRDLGGYEVGEDYSHRLAFELLWKQLNGGDSWDANPWVWRIETKPAAAQSEAA